MCNESEADAPNINETGPGYGQPDPVVMGITLARRSYWHWARRVILAGSIITLIVVETSNCNVGERNGPQSQNDTGHYGGREQLVDLRP